MEFFLVPLLAIILVTFAIYKLTALLFHIHLSSSLLTLLVLFAWLISFIMPGLFFPATSFLGSVGISLVSAVGFAWLATTFDARQNKVKQNQTETTIENFVNDAPWTPTAEIAFPMESAIPKEGNFDAGLDIISESIRKQNQTQISELLNQGIGAEKFASVADAFMFDEFDEPEETSTESFSSLPQAVEMSDLSEPIEVVNIPTSSSPEAEGSLEFPPVIEQAARRQPVSEALEDLLEFAFEQRSCNNGKDALETFRLVRRLYADSQTLPMVVAEIVSVLQSAGLYDEAIAELSTDLQLPTIICDPRLVKIFEQKLDYLQILRDFLLAQGAPELPFEQIPAEWGAWVEQKVLAGNRVQS